MTLLYDRISVPQLALETAIVVRAEGLALIRNHHGEGRHDTQVFRFRG